MRILRLGLSVATMGLLMAGLVGIATAQDDPPPAQDGPPAQAGRGRRMQNPEFRQRMLDEFDKDGNGELDDAERQTMRETMRERREQMRERFGQGPDGPPPPRGDRSAGPPPPRGDRPDGPPGEGRGPGARRGPGGPPGGGPGRHGPGPLEGLFEWFDGNHDNQLSREEFHELAQFVHERRHHGPPPEGGPEGRGFGRRGPDGPPPGDGPGRGGPRGRRWNDGPGRRGPEGPPPGGPPPGADDGGPPPLDSPPPHDDGAQAAPPTDAVEVAS